MLLGEWFMSFIMIIIQVLLFEIIGVALFTGVLYLYWNVLKKK